MPAPSSEQLTELVQRLRQGGVIACPTETLQGLLADALNPAAVERVVALKRRGPDPIALLVPDLDAACALSAAPLSKAARSLAERYWPGPLTLVLPARSGLHPALAPQGTIGVRVPGESPALDVVCAFGGPLTATSANLSGQPPAATHAEVLRYFEGQLDGVFPEDAPGGAPSSVVDATGARLRLLRAGRVQLPEL